MELEIHLFHARVTAVLVLWVSILRNSSCSICQKNISEAEDPCETGGIDGSMERIKAGSLEIVNWSTYPCSLVTRYGNFDVPLFKNSSGVLSELKATQCFTEGTPLYVGLTLSWTMNITDENMRGLTITVLFSDYLPFLHKLYLNLTQHLDIGEVVKFSTKCIPFKGIENGHSFTVTATDNNQGGLVAPPVNISIDCDEVPKKFRDFCPGMPEQRPVATAHCNNSVSVAFTPEAPPGLGNRANYSVEICLYEEDTQVACKTPTLRDTVGTPYPPKVYFQNVTEGTYNVKFAFLDDYGLPCGNHRYRAKNIFTVEECKKPLVEVVVIPLGALLIGGLCTIVICILIRQQRVKDVLHPTEFDSLSGTIIIGAEHPPGAEDRMDENGSEGRRPCTEMSNRLPFPPQNNSPGHLPTTDELVSINDGRSCIITI